MVKKMFAALTVFALFAGVLIAGCIGGPAPAAGPSPTVTAGGEELPPLPPEEATVTPQAGGAGAGGAPPAPPA